MDRIVHKVYNVCRDIVGGATESSYEDTRVGLTPVNVMSGKEVASASENNPHDKECLLYQVVEVASPTVSLKNMNIIDKKIKEFEKKFQYWEGIKVFAETVLDEKEVKILDMREQKKTLEEVGKEFGITRERVRQIEAKANEKVRMKDYFKDWLRTTLEDVAKHST